jgi:hypothetical protein
MKELFEKIMMLVTTLCLVFGILPVERVFADVPEYRDVAEHYAPVFFHDVYDSSYCGKESDFFTKVDYDGDWVGNNNWDNRDNYEKPAYVYYDVSETETHYYILYQVFHPRDDHPTIFDKHENDLESVLVVAEKDSTEYGEFLYVRTQFHSTFKNYSNDPRVYNAKSSLTGNIDLEDDNKNIDNQSGYRARLYIQQMGHGIESYTGGIDGDDGGIIYRYIGEASIPERTFDTNAGWQEYGYDLLSYDELWDQRDNRGSGKTFDEWGKLDGDNYKIDAAGAPWAEGSGVIWSNPALQFDCTFNVDSDFSHNYLHNDNWIYKITLESVTAHVNEFDKNDPNTDKADVYIDLVMNGNNYVGKDYWMKWDVPVDQPVSIELGKETYGTNHFSSVFNTVYIAQPKDSTINMYFKDYDESNTDDPLGEIQITPSSPNTVRYENVPTSNGKAHVTFTVEYRP